MDSRVEVAVAVGLVALALFACKQGGSSGEAGAKCAGDGDCKNGLLCEGEVCVPEEVAKRARAAASAAAAAPAPAVPTPTPSASASSAVPGDEPTVRGFEGAGMKSKVPTITEWNEAGEVTVRHSSPLGCETKMVREWLRVSCRTARGGNQISDVSVLEASGVKKYEIFTFKREGVASIVLPIRHPIEAKVRFLWSQWGARTLTISYPQGAPAPKIHFDRTAPGGATAGSQGTSARAAKPCVYCTNQAQEAEARDRGLPCCAAGIQCAEKLGCISRGICCMR